jgi:hypothetical protein
MSSATGSIPHDGRLILDPPWGGAGILLKEDALVEWRLTRREKRVRSLREARAIVN